MKSAFDRSRVVPALVAGIFVILASSWLGLPLNLDVLKLFGLFTGAGYALTFLVFPKSSEPTSIEDEEMGESDA